MSGLLTATLMGSIAEDLDWLGTLLGGLTIMPYVSHSVYGGQLWLLCQACLGYTDQDCGDYRFDVITVCVCVCVIKESTQ